MQFFLFQFVNVVQFKSFCKTLEAFSSITRRKSEELVRLQTHLCPQALLDTLEFLSPHTVTPHLVSSPSALPLRSLPRTSSFLRSQQLTDATPSCSRRDFCLLLVSKEPQIQEPFEVPPIDQVL